LTHLNQNQFSNCYPASRRSENRLSLHDARRDVPYLISAFDGGKEMLQKLMELGLPVGSEIRILRHQAGGGAVIGKDNLRLALGPTLASSILVIPV
jgi:Fe2+ transport system protein FeoA